MAITSIKTGSSFTNLVKYNDFLGPNSAYIPSSYESIASATPTSTFVTFSSIPQTYKHLQIRVTGRTTFATTNWELWLQFNGDAGTNYVYHFLQGNGSSATAGAFTTQNLIRIGDITGSSSAASIFGVSICDILDYTSTNKNKTVRSLSGNDANGSGIVALKSNLWLNTAAITSIKVSTASDSFATGSVISLYGIKG